MQITNTTIFHLLHFHGNTRNLPFTFFRKLSITVILWRNWRCHNLHFFLLFAVNSISASAFLKICLSLMKMKTIKCIDFLYIKLDWLLGNQTTWKIKCNVVLLKQQVLKPQIVNYASTSSPTGINHSCACLWNRLFHHWFSISARSKQITVNWLLWLQCLIYRLEKP